MKISEIKMEHILKTAPAGIGVIYNRVITWGNSKLLEMVGYSEEELIGKSARLVYDSDEEFDRVGAVEYGSDGGTGSVHTQWKKRDGTLIDIQLNLTAVNQEDFSEGIIFTAMDIRELKEAEKELRKSKERFSKMFYFSPQIVALSTIAEGRYLEANDAFLKVTGYKREEVIGHTAGELHLWADPEERNKVIALMKEHGAVINSEIKFRRKNGEVIGTLCSMVNIDMDGQDCVLALVVDISERKLMEEKLMKLNEELEQRVMERTRELSAINKELESFCYSVSHDLRAPLRSINGFSLAILEDYSDKLDEEGHDYLQRICKASQNMSGLIDDLLNLSRVTRSSIKPEYVNLSSLVDRILNDHYEREKRSNVDLIVCPGIIIHGDERLLIIAMENLLGNAWKFTSKNNYTRIEFGTIKDKGHTVYFISDNGAGFDMTYGDKLFGPFQRLHTAAEFSGTGIGLATVQRIIHRHGGHIWAEGHIGKGAVFYFTLETGKEEQIRL